MSLYSSNLDMARGQIFVRIHELQGWNEDPNYRSRELSLAITNFEQGLMWLARAIEVVAAKEVTSVPDQREGPEGSGEEATGTAAEGRTTPNCRDYEGFRRCTAGRLRELGNNERCLKRYCLQ
jgi:hypothetical protein